jgi:hypothetical protein
VNGGGDEVEEVLVAGERGAVARILERCIATRAVIVELGAERVFFVRTTFLNRNSRHIPFPMRVCGTFHNRHKRAFVTVCGGRFFAQRCGL